MTLLPQRSKFDKYVDLGLVRSQTDATGALTIYNYTEFTRYERLWNAVTRQTRGLVLDNHGRVIIRCLPKFFNSDEPEALMEPPTGMPVVQNKLDGSLIQVVDDPEYGLVVTSKGSFQSDQARWAHEIIIDEGMEFDGGISYILELIHPDNRIVIDYGDQRALILLAAVETATGVEYDIYGPRFDRFTRAGLLDASALEDVNALAGEGVIEGVVVKYDNCRVKMKTDEYVRLHRVVTDFTPKRVWEALSTGASLEFDHMPEEFQAWLDETVAQFRAEYKALEVAILDDHRRVESLADKELGLSDGYQYKNFIFMLRRGKDIAPGIWKLIKPTQSELAAA